MNTNIKKLLFGDGRNKRPPALLAVTPPRTGERTLLGVENLLQSIAVPEPFSLELAGDAVGVPGQLPGPAGGQAATLRPLPPGPHREVPPEDDPLRLDTGEQAWCLTLRSGGPEFVPLRTFRDDDLLDAGSDPLIALLGALGDLRPGERLVSRLLLRSLGPAWSQAHQQKAFKNPGQQRPDPSYTYHTKPSATGRRHHGRAGAGALAALKGYLWVQDGEFLKASLLGAGSVLGLTVAGWGWWRWKQARSRVYDPILIREKVSRIAFDTELQVVAVLPERGRLQRAEELLEGWPPPTATTTIPPGPGSRSATYNPWFPRTTCTPLDRVCSASAASWGCERWPPCGTRPASVTRLRWWKAPAPGPCCPRSGAPPRARWWATPPAGRPGRSASPRTCCAVTISTWPAPAWASPP